MSKDGLPVRKPKGKSVVAVETLAEESQLDTLSVSELKEQFDLDRVEKELLQLDKQEGFLERLFSSISDEQTIKRLKGKKEALELKRQIRQEIITIEEQNIKVKSGLLDLKAALLEKAVMSHEKVQKTLLDIKLKELSIKKIQKDLELLDLERKKKEWEKELEAHGKSGPGERYDLKSFQTLGEPFEDNEDDEENG